MRVHLIMDILPPIITWKDIDDFVSNNVEEEPRYLYSSSESESVSKLEVNSHSKPFVALTLFKN